MKDLSIIIPARREEFLARTVEDILEHIEADTEVIVVLDGEWASPPLKQDPRVTVLYFPESIGQRAACNQAVRLSEAKYIMKVDAHCAFDQGFDRKMIEHMRDDWTMVPVMRNLHVFDWVCPDGHRRYQDAPGPCKECGKRTVKEMIWIPKQSPQSSAYRFDKTLHFQYFPELKKRQQGDLVETMSLQGSCFMCTRKKYWELEMCDERHGSWGQQGVEVACKTWLSGGQVIVNKHTWYAHLFRTQPGFSFPYPNTDIERARAYSRDLWFNNKWPKAKYPLNWLIDKFAPVPDWHEIKKGVVYYTCNTHEPKIDEECRKQLASSFKGETICISLNKKVNFGHKEIVLEGERGPLTMHRQVLKGLEESTADIVFLCESDVMYHPSHFDFVPPRRDIFYYNEHTYKVNYFTGQAVFYYTKQVSGCCAYRNLLVDFYRKRIEIIEKEGFNRHYEAGQKNTNQGIFPVTKGGIYGQARYMSKYPNVDIRHDKNITVSKWKPEDFRDPNSCLGWTEVEEIPGWGRVPEILQRIK